MVFQGFKRTFLIVAVLAAALCVAAQTPDIEKHITSSSAGQVTISAPAGLAKREVNKAKEDDKKVAKNPDNQSDLAEDKAADSTEADEKKDTNNQRRSDGFIANRSVGFRIQAFSDNNYKNAKQNAQARARVIAAKFPQWRTYLAYKAPTWRLRVGDFKNKEEAQKALAALKRSFPSYSGQFSIVRDRINIWGYDK